MKKEKTYNLVLSVVILAALILLMSVFYLIAVEIPHKAENDFGEADADFDNSQRLVKSIWLELHRNDLIKPVSSDRGEVLFTVAYGETAAQVSGNLAASGLLHSEETFTDFLEYRGIDDQIQAGIYSLSPSMNALEIADRLVDSDPKDVAFSFLPGWRAEEIAALLPSSGLEITPEEFLQVVRQPDEDLLPSGFAKATSLEGLMFPGEYQVLRISDANTIANIFSVGFTTHLPANFESNVKSKGLTAYEGIILASIVQKEMVVEEDASYIASVLINRLNADMSLQSDPTVQYTVGYDQATGTWWKNPLTAADLQIDSPYNTYLNAGLPPAPICNPGLTALQAVIDAPETDYLYFRAACDGSGRHIFSVTYEQHLEAACP
jgi:UPF0755 protein